MLSQQPVEGNFCYIILAKLMIRVSVAMASATIVVSPKKN